MCLWLSDRESVSIDTTHAFQPDPALVWGW